MKQKSLRALILVFVCLAIPACDSGGSMIPTPLTPTVPTITTMPALGEMLADKTLGSASAPNTLLEYLSFWCSNCATYYATVFPQLKSKYVDTGQMQIKFYNLFLSGETYNAANLARCAGTDRFFDAANLIFSRQSSWLNTSDSNASNTAVNQLMLGFGMSAELVNTCVADTDLSQGLFNIHQAAIQQWGMTAVPAIVINGTLLDGSTSDNAPTLANIEKYLK